MLRLDMIFLVGSVVSLPFCRPVQADVVLDWSARTLAAIRVDRTAPPKAARALAMVQIGVFDAINAISGTHEPFLPDGFTARGDESPEIAAICAAHDVLVALFPAQSATFDGAFESDLNFLSSEESVGGKQSKIDASVAIGQKVALAVLTARSDDGSAASVTYVSGVEPGDWQPTPPAFAGAVLPQWPSVTPFCVPDMVSIRRPGPPSLTSAEFTTTFNETKLLGAKNSTARTAEQTQIALFWVDGPGTATPPGHWFQIARDLAVQRGNTLEENARLFALLGMAVCDAGICAWDNKYAYNDWRPITAIRAADTDGNPDTVADPAWEPLIPTPAFPSYVSGHSTFSGAASKILALFYGSDEIEFTTTSDDVPGVARTYNRFSQAANEAGRSRIYGGIHWEYDNQDGLAAGRELGEFVFSNFLQPIDTTVITINQGDVVKCGPVGVIPLGLTLAGIVGLGHRPWAKKRRG